MQFPRMNSLLGATNYPMSAIPSRRRAVAAIRDDTDGPHWTDTARRILTKSTDRVQVLRKFIQQFSLPGWDASRAAEVQSKLQLLDEMATYSDSGLTKFAVKEKARLSQAITAAREVSPPVYMDIVEG